MTKHVWAVNEPGLFSHPKKNNRRCEGEMKGKKMTEHADAAVEAFSADMCVVLNPKVAKEIHGIDKDGKPG